MGLRVSRAEQFSRQEFQCHAHICWSVPAVCQQYLTICPPKNALVVLHSWWQRRCESNKASRCVWDVYKTGLWTQVLKSWDTWTATQILWMAPITLTPFQAQSQLLASSPASLKKEDWIYRVRQGEECTPAMSLCEKLSTKPQQAHVAEILLRF